MDDLVTPLAQEEALEKLSAAAATQQQLPELALAHQASEVPGEEHRFADQLQQKNQLEQHQQQQNQQPEQEQQPPPVVGAAPIPAIDPLSLHPFLEAKNAQGLAAYLKVPLRALVCVELMESQQCTAKGCPYPAAYRTASGNKNGTFPKCVLHNQTWYPKPTKSNNEPKGHFLLGHVFLRPQKKPGDTKLPPCCWHCSCGDDYCKGIGYTPYARSIPVRQIEGVLEALRITDHETCEKMRQNPKNFSVAPWHFHPNSRELDANGRWKLKPLESTLVFTHSSGELVDADWDQNQEICRGERVWRSFPPPTYNIRNFVGLEVLPRVERLLGDTNHLPLWAIEMAKADIQNIRTKLPPEIFVKPKKKARGPKRKTPGPEISRDELQSEVKRQSKRIQQLEKGWTRNDRIIQELRNDNAALKAQLVGLKTEYQNVRSELKKQPTNRSSGLQSNLTDTAPVQPSQLNSDKEAIDDAAVAIATGSESQTQSQAVTEDRTEIHQQQPVTDKPREFQLDDIGILTAAASIGQEETAAVSTAIAPKES